MYCINYYNSTTLTCNYTYVAISINLINICTPYIDSKHPSAQFHHIRPRAVDQHHTIWFESQYWMNTVISYHHCGHTRKPTPITWFDIFQYSATYQRSWGSRKSSWCFQWWPLCTLDWPNLVGLVFGGSEYDPGYEDGATLLLTYNRIKKTHVFSLD